MKLSMSEESECDSEPNSDVRFDGVNGVLIMLVTKRKGWFGPSDEWLLFSLLSAEPIFVENESRSHVSNSSRIVILRLDLNESNSHNSTNSLKSASKIIIFSECNYLKYSLASLYRTDSE